MILAVETSCDDTCAAVVSAAGEIRSNRVASQGLLHARYGGVVPEVASRRHLEAIDAVAADALETAGVGLDDIDSVAVTRGPGLIGALLVGFSWAKATAAARRLPLTPVDHLHGHVVASTLREERTAIREERSPIREERNPIGDRASTAPTHRASTAQSHPASTERGSLAPDPVEPPYLSLVASGGHTFLARVEDPSEYRILGQTLDDAAGEAFDKGARLLGLGYPGGAELDRLAREGDPDAFAFPRSAPGDGLDFSFSGLKTALLYRVRDLGEGEAERRRADLAASYQAAIVAALTARVAQAIGNERLQQLAIGGGVAANSGLREALTELCGDLGVRLHAPSIELCTDNAAMIAAASRFLDPIPYPGYLGLDAAARIAA